MLDVEAMSLIPGAMFGQGSAAEQQMPAEAVPGGGSQGLAVSEGAKSWGAKMPAGTAIKADIAVGAVRDAKQKEADKANPLFSFLGLPGTSWQDVEVFAGLTILFLVGVVLLFSAVGVQTGTAANAGARLRKVASRI